MARYCKIQQKNIEFRKFRRQVIISIRNFKHMNILTRTRPKRFHCSILSDSTFSVAILIDHLYFDNLFYLKCFATAPLYTTPITPLSHARSFYFSSFFLPSNYSLSREISHIASLERKG